MNDEPRKKLTAYWIARILVVVLPLAYVVSFPFILGQMEQGNISRASVESFIWFYTPLMWLGDNYEPFAEYIFGPLGRWFGFYK